MASRGSGRVQNTKKSSYWQAQSSPFSQKKAKFIQRAEGPVTS